MAEDSNVNITLLPELLDLITGYVVGIVPAAVINDTILVAIVYVLPYSNDITDKFVDVFFTIKAPKGIPELPFIVNVFAVVV